MPARPHNNSDAGPPVASPRDQTEDLRIKDAVIAASLSPTMITDLDGHITYVNSAFLRLWGYERREEIIGRNLSDGAPLSGGTTQSQVDLDAVDERGLSVIAPTAHARLAAPTNPRERILRRPYNFGTGVAGDAGQIFVAFAADPTEQFVGIQRRLAESDLLNTWVTYTGSAIAAVPPGFSPGGWIGETLLNA